MNELMFKAQIAKHLKSLRAQKGMSLAETAKVTGVSKAMLGQIERQESSPTIATLWKIASGLSVSFSAFFANQASPSANDALFPDDPKMNIRTLFPFKVDTGVEMFEITLTAYHQQMSSPHSAGVIEYIHVLHGQLSLYVDRQWQLMQKGESRRFFADQSHGYWAISETAVFQNIICYPR